MDTGHFHGRIPAIYRPSGHENRPKRKDRTRRWAFLARGYPPKRGSGGMSTGISSCTKPRMGGNHINAPLGGEIAWGLLIIPLQMEKGCPFGPRPTLSMWGVFAWQASRLWDNGAVPGEGRMCIGISSWNRPMRGNIKWSSLNLTRGKTRQGVRLYWVVQD